MGPAPFLALPDRIRFLNNFKFSITPKYRKKQLTF